MASENEEELMPSALHTLNITEDEPAAAVATPHASIMQKFRLYETQSNFYMVGRNKSRTYWRVLKIDRLEPCELNIREDCTTYTESECCDLLRRIHEGNRSTGGLKFVTTCYGIVGFIKFLGPYYMLLITKRRQIGAICGHTIYSVSKSEILPLPNPAVRSEVINSKNENRYKKLLCTVDLTKDFFFSYSYRVMRSFQKNVSENESGQVLYETMFVWNEFLTRGIRNLLQNTLWTVALVYGFFKQTTYSLSGRDLKLTLIARRSRHYAGTRYLKRGVNEKGRVANDVETEQIVFEDVSEGSFPMQISSVVQNRGSIPLFWSQETSRLNLKPDIILSKRDQTYQATRLHFDNLVKRYGNPIIILNLIKTHEKRPRESILRAEFANAIESINKDLPEENHLKFLHWDLHKHSRSKATNVLLILSKLATYALTLTGFFYCQVSPTFRSEGCLKWPYIDNVIATNMSSPNHCNFNNGRQYDNDKEDAKNSETIVTGGNNVADRNYYVNTPLFQKGVLRTNCIDCLDRTNVAQYAYGLVALGEQLNALGVKNSSKIDLDDPLADELMRFYERMGDTLAHQYGGSAAHNKIFSQRRGQWKTATQSQEFFRTLQRYYSNAYMDAEKQSSINLFLGNFRPQHDKSEVWELDSNQRYDVYRNGQPNVDENGRSLFKRCMSDGNILHESRSMMSTSNNEELSNRCQEGSKVFSGSTPDVSACKSDLSCSRYTQIPRRELFEDVQRDRCLEYDNGDAIDCSNFVDLDWLSSSANSCDEEVFDGSTLSNSPVTVQSSDNIVNELVGETTPSTSGYGSSMKGGEMTGTELSYDDGQNYDVLEEFSDSFVQWVTYGETLCH